MIIWKEALQLFKHKWLFGVGPGNTQHYAIQYQIGTEKLVIGAAVHNSYLDLLVEYGTVGAVTLFGFLVACCVRVLKKMLGNQDVNGTHTSFGRISTGYFKRMKPMTVKPIQDHVTR